MQKKVWTTVAILAASCYIGTAMAQQIGVLDVREVVNQAPAAKAVSDKLKKEFKPREDEVAAAEKKLQDLTQKMNKDADTLSEIERAKLERNVGNQQREVQKLRTEFSEDAQLRQREEMQKILAKVREKVQAIAKDKKLDLVIHSDATPFYTPEIDLTAAVIAAMKE